jgi:hypothetical protein
MEEDEKMKIKKGTGLAIALNLGIVKEKGSICYFFLPFCIPDALWLSIWSSYSSDSKSYRLLLC